MRYRMAEFDMEVDIIIAKWMIILVVVCDEVTIFNKNNKNNKNNAQRCQTSKVICKRGQDR